MGACQACDAGDREDYAPKLEDLENEQIRLEGGSRPPLVPKRTDENGTGGPPPPPPAPVKSPPVKAEEMPKVSVQDRVSMFDFTDPEENKDKSSNNSLVKPRKKPRKIVTGRQDTEEEYDGWTGETRTILPSQSEGINFTNKSRRRSNGVSSPKPYSGRAPPTRDPSLIDPSLILRKNIQKMANGSTSQNSGGGAPPLPPRSPGGTLAPPLPPRPSGSSDKSKRPSAQNVFAHDVMKGSSPRPPSRPVNSLLLPSNSSSLTIPKAKATPPPRPPPRPPQSAPISAPPRISEYTGSASPKDPPRAPPRDPVRPPPNANRSNRRGLPRPKSRKRQAI